MHCGVIHTSLLLLETYFMRMSVNGYQGHQLGLHGISEIVSVVSEFMSF